MSRFVVAVKLRAVSGGVASTTPPPTPFHCFSRLPVRSQSVGRSSSPNAFTRKRRSVGRCPLQRPPAAGRPRRRHRRRRRVLEVGRYDVTQSFSALCYVSDAQMCRSHGLSPIRLRFERIGWKSCCFHLVSTAPRSRRGNSNYVNVDICRRSVSVTCDVSL